MNECVCEGVQVRECVSECVSGVEWRRIGKERKSRGPQNSFHEFSNATFHRV